MKIEMKKAYLHSFSREYGEIIPPFIIPNFYYAESFQLVYYEIVI